MRMSAALVAIEECAETCQESLAGRLSRGPLPLAEALQYAIEIATCLRDLHRQRLVYGAVSSQSILLGPAGAALRGTGGLAQLGDRREDVKAYSALLREILRSTEGWAELCAEIDALAAHCQDQTPDIQHALIALRLLLLRLRHASIVIRRPVLVPRIDPAIPKRTARLRIHLALHWKPLVSLAALAFPGK